jgi:hypothetical protein
MGYDFAYSLTYGNNNREIIGNSIMISANTDLTPKWKAYLPVMILCKGYFHTNSFRTRFVGEWISTGHLLEQMRTGDSSLG